MNKYEFSLLWPKDSDKETILLPEETIDSLNIKEIISLITPNKRIGNSLFDYLTKLPTSKEVIIHRQKSLQDLMENSELLTALQEVSPILSSMHYYNGRAKREDSKFYEMVFRINELGQLISVVDRLYDVFSRLNNPIKSQGFNNLKLYVYSFKKRNEYVKLSNTIPKMLNSLSDVKSLSLGINLNSGFIPESITVDRINKFSYKSPGNNLMEKLFPDCNRGLIQLIDDSFYDTLSPIFRDLTGVIDKACNPIIHKIKEFRNTNTSALINLKLELDFLLTNVNLFKKISAMNVVISIPKILNKEETILKVENSTNLNLILSQNISPVANEINLNKNTSFALITGPNSGGKTVYLQSLGLNQILAQSGLYILGNSAEVSIVDNIYTHYQVDEVPGEDQGRFGMELKRLGKVLPNITKYSLLLFNETFSSTSVSDAIEVADDILKYISELGTRGAYTTHIKPLTKKVYEKSIFLLSAESSNGINTHKIIKGVYSFCSYGKELANKMGISYSQLAGEKLYCSNE